MFGLVFTHLGVVIKIIEKQKISNAMKLKVNNTCSLKIINIYIIL